MSYSSTYFLEVFILALRLLICITIIPFVILQWKVRKKNGIVRKLRYHVIAESVAIMLLVFASGLNRFYILTHNGFNILPTWANIFSIISTIAVFVTFASGINLFLVIRKEDTLH